MRGFYSREEIAQIAETVLGELLPGGSVQHPYTQSAVQNYKIGSRLQTPDGLVWHYAKASPAGVTAAYRRRGVASVVLAQNFKVLAIAPIGATTLVINDTALATVHPADYWAKGHASIFPLPGYANDQPRMIKSSTAGNGVSVTLTLYYPIDYALAINDDVYCCPSPYRSVCEAVSVPGGAQSIVGFAWMALTPLYYAWLQTWGLCQPVATGGDQGITAGGREIFFNYGDGTTFSGPATAFGASQRAGFLVPQSILAPGGDESYLMLQLDP